LVGFGKVPNGLDVDDLLDPVTREDVMTPSDTLLETQAQQNMSEIIEAEVAVAEP
jgi:hypothetical protein